MLQTLPAVAQTEPPRTGSIELAVTLTPADYLHAYDVGQAELQRRAFASGIGGGMSLPRVSAAWVVTSFACIGVLTVRLHRPDAAFLPADWVLMLLLMMPLGLATVGMQQLIGPWLRRDLLRRTAPLARTGAAPTATGIAVGAAAVTLTNGHGRLEVPHQAHHTAVDTPSAYIVVGDSAVVPIPKAGLDWATHTMVRTALAGWNLRPPERASPIIPGVAIALGALGFLLLFGLGSNPGPVAAQPTPGRRADQASVRLTDRFMRIDGWRTALENEDYRVWMVGGHMYDQLRGTIRHRAAEGWFWLGRHQPGNTVRSPMQELREMQGTTDGSGPVPDYAVMTTLPDNGVLLTWLNGPTGGSCGTLRSYRDQVPAETLPPGTPTRYRRNLVLRFCAPALSPAELGDWMQDAVPAFHAEFNAVVRP